MTNPANYLKEVFAELQRVVWPAPRTVALHTVIVIISMIVIILLVGGIDSLLVKLVQALILRG